MLRRMKIDKRQRKREKVRKRERNVLVERRLPQFAQGSRPECMNRKIDVQEFLVRAA